MKSSFIALGALLVSSAVQSGCAWFGVAAAPEKAAKPDTSASATVAQEAFWATLHGGDYAGIGPVLEQLKAVYLEQPSDPNVAAHIGFLHVWRISERARLSQVPASITDDMLLARRYFDEAVRLDDDDPRIQGFLAATMLAEGQIQADEKLKRQGYFAMQDAVAAWPEFNLFTSGIAMSGLPAEDEHYAEGLAQQWETLERCAEQEIDPKSLDYASFMPLETREGPKRVCWNSWIAPHNFEGFFLNMGDMLVKAGEPATAQRVYAQAKHSKQYASWPYRDLLERRIAQAADNVALFKAPSKNEIERRMMGQSSFACMGCHQRGQEPALPRARLGRGE